MVEIKCDSCGNTNNFSWKNDEDFIKWYNRKLREVAKEWIKSLDVEIDEKMKLGLKDNPIDFILGQEWVFKHFFNL